MKVHIQIERTPEPLHRQHCSWMSQLRRSEPQDPLCLHPQEMHLHLHHRPCDGAAEAAVFRESLLEEMTGGAPRAAAAHPEMAATAARDPSAVAQKRSLNK
jgi:hypothetical protein